jgi:hypothetical protein
MCVFMDYPYFDSNLTNVSGNLMRTVSRETAAKILLGGAGLYGFSEAHFAKAAAGAAKRAPAVMAAAGWWTQLPCDLQRD